MQYQKPTNVKELASQANDIANKLLNGEIELSLAAKYSSLVRATAQLKTLEVQKARMEKTPINLEL